MTLEAATGLVGMLSPFVPPIILVPPSEMASEPRPKRPAPSPQLQVASHRSTPAGARSSSASPARAALQDLTEQFPANVALPRRGIHLAPTAISEMATAPVPVGSRQGPMGTLQALRFAARMQGRMATRHPLSVQLGRNESGCRRSARWGGSAPSTERHLLLIGIAVMVGGLELPRGTNGGWLNAGGAERLGVDQD